MRCKTCHYPLKKLTEYCCPECGREFDPNDPLTFEDSARRLDERTAAAVVIVSTLLFFVGLALLPSSGDFMPALFATTMAIPIGMAVIFCLRRR